MGLPRCLVTVSDFQECRIYNKSFCDSFKNGRSLVRRVYNREKNMKVDCAPGLRNIPPCARHNSGNLETLSCISSVKYFCTGFKVRYLLFDILLFKFLSPYLGQWLSWEELYCRGMMQLIVTVLKTQWSSLIKMIKVQLVYCYLLFYWIKWFLLYWNPVCLTTFYYCCQKHICTHPPIYPQLLRFGFHYAVNIPGFTLAGFF